MRYTMLPYNSVWQSRKSYISGYTQYISTYAIGQKYISVYLRYTFGQSYMSRYTIIHVTQYMFVHLSMKFSDKVYTRMYWVHACIYFYSWFFVLNERAHTCTYSYVWAHTMCNCFVPACARPASLHPAGLLEFVSSAFVAESSLTLSSSDHFILIPAPPLCPGGRRLFGGSGRRGRAGITCGLRCRCGRGTLQCAASRVLSSRLVFSVAVVPINRLRWWSLNSGTEA